MDPLTTWLTHEASVFGLEMLRIAGLLVAGPLTWTFLPAMGRAGLVFALALLIHQPTEALDLHSLSPLRFMLSAGVEFGIGAAIGFVARLVLAVGEVAADAIAPIMGLGAAQMFDPTLGGQGTILTQLLRYFGIWAALCVGLHHLLLGALFSSFTGIPTGTLLNPGVLGIPFISMTAGVLESGIKLALPLMAVLFIVQVCLAFIARAAPAMQIFSIGFAVSLGIGFLVWVVFAPDLLRELTYLRGWAESNLQIILQTLKEG